MIQQSLIEKEKLYELVGFKPHSQAQYDIMDSAARFNTYCCGRRWGKSTIAGMRMTMALFVPDAWYWIVGPDYSLAEKEFRVVHRNIVQRLKVPKLKKVTYNKDQGNMVIEMPWNTIVECKSAKQPDKLVGEGLDGVIMSEAAKHSKETWERYIEPSLTDKRGWADFPSTPEGFNWYYGMYQLGEEPHMTDYASWQLPSWTNPIVFPGGREDDEIKRIENVATKQWFDQEIGAKFTSFEGQIYDEFNDDDHVISEYQFNPAWKNYWAVDFGFSAPFVVLDIQVDPSDNVFVWREYVVRYLTTWEHADMLKDRRNPEGFNLIAICADPRGAEDIATLRLKGIGPILCNPTDWKTGIEAVKRWLKVKEDGKPKLFIDRACRETIRQMKGLRRPTEREGHNPKEGQHDYDDHCCDALRYFFDEWEVRKMGGSLSAAYSGAKSYKGSEADTFVTNRTKITLDSHIGY